MKRSSEATRSFRIVIGALAGAAVGVYLNYAADMSGVGVFLVLLCAMLGASEGRASGVYSFDDKCESTDVCRKVRQVTERIVFAMGPSYRSRMAQHRTAVNIFSLCAIFYAILLGMLESGNVGIYEEYLRFCAPLVNFVSDFFPRAAAVRDALQYHGYAARAEFAEHIIVMMRLVSLPLAIIMVAMLVHVYRGCRPAQFRCTRLVFYAYHISIYLACILIAGVVLAFESGLLTGLEFSSSVYGIDKIWQYHETNAAAVIDAVFAAMYPAVILFFCPIILAHRALLITPNKR